MASLADYGDAVIGVLGAALPTVPTVELYAGQFGAQDAKRVQFRSPAVFVAVTKGTVEEDGTEGLVLTLQVTAYCVAQSARGRQARAVSAAALAETVALTARGQQWGLAGLSPTKLRQLEAMHADSLDRQGLAIWNVSWTQQIRTGESVWDSDAVAPTSVWLGWDPDIGPPHVEDYEEVAGG